MTIAPMCLGAAAHSLIETHPRFLREEEARRQGKERKEWAVFIFKAPPHNR